MWALGGVLAPLGKMWELFSSLCSDFIVSKLGFHLNLLHKAVVPVLSAVIQVQQNEMPIADLCQTSPRCICGVMFCPCLLCSSTGDESHISPCTGKTSSGQETLGADKSKEMLRISLSEEWHCLCLCEQGGAPAVECPRAGGRAQQFQVLREGWQSPVHILGFVPSSLCQD